MKRKAGFALVLTLVVTTLMAAAALELSREVRISAALAGNFQDRTRARLQALDGLGIAAQALLSDRLAWDSLDEDWASLSRTMPDDGPQIEIKDLSGLINLNRLIAEQGGDSTLVGVLERLLILLGQRPDPVTALLDWLDSDNLPRAGGAEIRDYQERELKRRPRNGALPAAEELALIPGFSQALLHGQGTRPGLLDLVTVYGGLRINVNTAPPLVLLALDQAMTSSLVEDIVELRRRRGIRTLEELQRLPGLTPALFQRISPILTVRSSWFLVSSTGRHNRSRHELRAVLNREGESVSLEEIEVGS